MTKLTLQEAFDRLKKDNQIIERTGSEIIHWYWHDVGPGKRIMASRKMGTELGYCDAPYFYPAFFIVDPPVRKPYT